MKIKIEVIDRKTLHEREMREIAENRVQEEDYIIYFDSMESLHKVLSNKRVDLLKAITGKKPKSLYALARILGRDFKNVHTDARLLEAHKLITLKKVKNGKRVSLRPVSKVDRIELTFAT